MNAIFKPAIQDYQREETLTKKVTLVCVICVFSLAFLSACSSFGRLGAVPDDLYSKATIPDMPNIRFFIDEDTGPFMDAAFDALEREKKFLNLNGDLQEFPPVSFLAISGGGDNGAFGAGLLTGWSKTGTRPEFKAVTGVSTGALIAPFAFLGSDYDDLLTEVYTQITPEDISVPRWFLNIIMGDSAADNSAMWTLVEKYATAEILHKIGEEYDKGRLLLIATTNLDTQRPVVWNIGEIAKSGSAGALKLFQSVLVASASVPGAFSPVMFDVEVDGEKYQEMHVDGGAVAQVFLYPPSIELKKEVAERGHARKRTLYVIRNARLDSEWASVERNIFDIVRRAIVTLIQSQGVGDLYRIFLAAQRDGIDFNLAFIPSSFDAEHKQEFDPVYMNKLYNLALEMAKTGNPWIKHPPGYRPPNL